MSLVRNETQQHSAALKSAGQNPISLLPLNKRKVLHFYDSTLNLFVITSRCQAYLFCLPKPKPISNSVVSCIIIERVFDLSFNEKRIRRATCQGSPFPTRRRSLSERDFSERCALGDGVPPGAGRPGVIPPETQKERFRWLRVIFIVPA